MSVGVSLRELGGQSVPPPCERQGAVGGGGGGEGGGRPHGGVDRHEATVCHRLGRHWNRKNIGQIEE